MKLELDSVYEEILEKALFGREIKRRDAAELMTASGPEYHGVCAAADKLRHEKVGDGVTYVMNRNINFTNVCKCRCKFCNYRSDKGYTLTIEDALKKASVPGITELCIQGGLNPELGLSYYTGLVQAIRRSFPNIHIHAFSPAEVMHMAAQESCNVNDVLFELKMAGVNSMPGTSAEILDDAIRSEICPEKITTKEWIDVITRAHKIGIPTTATMMYGHIESIKERIDHMILLREMQKKTGGFTEFIPLTFMAKNELGEKFKLSGASGREDILLYAVARILLNDTIQNIQSSWVKLGKKLAQLALMTGANDLGGTLFEENISKASGSQYGENITKEEFEVMIRDLGKTPHQRDTLYNRL